MAELNLKKLKIVPEDEIVLKSENEAFTKRILEVLVAKDKKQDQALETLQQAVRQLMTKIESKLDISLTDLKKQVNNLFVEEKVKNIDTQTKTMFAGLKDEIGKIVNQKLREVDFTIEKKVTEKARPGMRGEPGRPPTRQEIDLALQPTVEAFRKEWEAKVQSRLSQRGLGVGGGRQIRMASFSFSGDGSTTSFQLDHQPGAKGKAIWAFLNGQQIQLGTHFNVNHKKLDTTFTPASADTIEGYMILM